MLLVSQKIRWLRGNLPSTLSEGAGCETIDYLLTRKRRFHHQVGGPCISHAPITSGARAGGTDHWTVPNQHYKGLLSVGTGMLEYWGCWRGRLVVNSVYQFIDLRSGSSLKIFVCSICHGTYKQRICRCGFLKAIYRRFVSHLAVIRAWVFYCVKGKGQPHTILRVR